MGTQKNSLTESVLLSTHNVSLGREMRKLNFNYALLYRGMLTLIMVNIFMYYTPPQF